MTLRSLPVIFLTALALIEWGAYIESLSALSGISLYTLRIASLVYRSVGLLTFVAGLLLTKSRNFFPS